jgi:hypothetical protein
LQLRAVRRHVSRRFFWALVASLVLHGCLAGILAFLFLQREITPGLPEPQLTVSSVIEITQRPRPRIAIATPHPQTAAPKQQPRIVRSPHSAPPRRELARVEIHAPRIPRPAHNAGAQRTLDTAREQIEFTKTIARLREQNDALVSSQAPVMTPAPAKRFVYDFTASMGSAPRGEGILYPVQSWSADGYDYYYVKYWVEYPDGTTESGRVPWPLRYAVDQDPFRLGIHHLPLPTPLANYSLPPGTSMHPLVAYCYEHRDELSSCPIYHN